MRSIIALTITFLVARVVLAGLDPFLGEIIAWPVSYVPRGWYECDGRLLAVNQNSALFSLLGCQFGGNCQTTFALPDLRGRGIRGMSTDPIGTVGGSDVQNLIPGQVRASGQIAITADNLPAHTHAATFTGQEETTNFVSKIAVSTSPGNPTPQQDGYLSQGTNTGSGSARIFQPPGSTVPRVELNGGSGSITSTPEGTVNVASAGAVEPSPLTANLGVSGQVNVQNPYMTLRYIIAYQGIFPPRD